MVMMSLVKLQTGQHSKLQHCSANKHLGRSSFTYRHVIDKNVFNIVSELGWNTSTLKIELRMEIKLFVDA